MRFAARGRIICMHYQIYKEKFPNKYDFAVEHISNWKDVNVVVNFRFCDRHGPKAQVNKPSAPTDLMCVAEAVMPRIILRLIQHLREHRYMKVFYIFGKNTA